MNQRQQLEQKLIEKALKDEAFKKQLVENPAKTIESEFKVKLPTSLKLTVLEEDAHTVFLVLPFSHLPVNTELTEAELESISGGTARVNPIVLTETMWPC
jgi:hypothetical protein